MIGLSSEAATSGFCKIEIWSSEQFFLNIAFISQWKDALETRLVINSFTIFSKIMTSNSNFNKISKHTVFLTTAFLVDKLLRCHLLTISSKFLVNIISFQRNFFGWLLLCTENRHFWLVSQRWRKTKASEQFIVFKSLTYCFQETIGFNK